MSYNLYYYLNKILKIQFIRFILTGIINTLFSLVIYWLLLWSGLEYYYAMLIANMLGILFNFKTTGKLVFYNSDNSLILKYILINILIYLISIVGVKLLIFADINEYYGAVIMAPVMAILSFLVNKIYVFEKKQR